MLSEVIVGVVAANIAESPLFKTITSNWIGNFGGDKFYLYSTKVSLERWIELADELEKILSEKGLILDKPQYISEKVGLPLVQNLFLEDDAFLRRKWGNMLVNALNPNFEHDITKNYVSILSDMNPSCVHILNYIGKKYNEADELYIDFKKTDIESDLGIKSKECKLSLLNLERLGCLKYDITRSLLPLKPNLKSDPTPSFDIERVSITELGLDFYASVN